MTAAVSAPLAPALLAVFVGAGCGACLRFALGQALNRLLPQLPLGTLVANLIGGYLVGVAIAFFAWRSELSVLWRLALITGFLGGLTTFSTFSAEVVNAFSRGDLGWALATAAAHLAGSLLLTVLGMATVRMFIAG
jgi:CrcB protein